MIETPLAVLNVAAIAAASTQGPGTPLAALVIGTNDLAREMRAQITPGRPALTTALSQCVLAARTYGLTVLDGTYNNLSNAEGLRQECVQGRVLGMDGKTLIHPRQVPVANDVFAPSNEEVAWAEKVLAAFERQENQGKGVIAVGGEMVERMHEAMARQIIETATAILPTES